MQFGLHSRCLQSSAISVHVKRDHAVPQPIGTQQQGTIRGNRQMLRIGTPAGNNTLPGESAGSLVNRKADYTVVAPICSVEKFPGRDDLQVCRLILSQTILRQSPDRLDFPQPTADFIVGKYRHRVARLVDHVDKP